MYPMYLHIVFVCVCVFLSLSLSLSLSVCLSVCLCVYFVRPHQSCVSEHEPVIAVHECLIFSPWLAGPAPALFVSGRYPLLRAGNFWGMKTSLLYIYIYCIYMYVTFGWNITNAKQSHATRVLGTNEANAKTTTRKSKFNARQSSYTFFPTSLPFTISSAACSACKTG